MRLGVREALVGAVVVPGDVVVEDEAIAAVGARPAGRRGLAVPGFVDLQVNGFAGVDYLEADADGYRRAGSALAATGVTAYQPTFISSPPEAYRRALAVATALGENPGGPRILGWHLEGPFISKAFAGAHNPAHIVDPDFDLVAELCTSGLVTYVTLAPEPPGALELIRMLRSRGVTVALGHSDADAAAAHAGFDSGATAVTHVYNAHRRFRARDPGLAGVALARDDVVVQAIVDHVHLAPETARVAFLAARGRFALVTDAMAAAALGPGTFRLGDRDVRVEGGEARLADGTLAGSVLTMDRAVRNLVDLGAPLPDAIAAAGRVPAALVGRGDIGTIEIGRRADVAVLRDDLSVARTLVGGEEVFDG